MNKWTYGDAGDRIPVRPGETWQVGSHRIGCACIEDLAGNPYSERPDVIYTDPPWGPGNATGFRTKAGESFKRKVDYWGGLYPALIRQCNTSKGAVFVEQGYNWIDKALGMFEEAGYRITHRWSVTYYRKHPSVLFRAVHRDNPDCKFESDLTGMDDEDTPRAVMQTYPAGTRFYDPCTGQGLLPLTAAQTGMVFQGVELNPRRTAVALDKLRIELGEEPRRIS